MNQRIGNNLTAATIAIDEPTIKWADDLDPKSISDGEGETTSISSEEETGSEYDGEQRARSKPTQELWNKDLLWSDLMKLPDAEEINDMFFTEDLENVLKKDSRTTVLLAAFLGRTSVLKNLIVNGASVNVADNNGRTPLHLAAYAEKLDCLKLLLDAGADECAWDKNREATPLHCAASVGHLPSIRMLIKYGANVNAGLNDKSPLHYAVLGSATDCVRELLENQANPNSTQVFTETPLHVAASLSSPQIVKLLLDHGAAPNVQSGEEKLTPLHLACEDGDSECAQLLIEGGAHVNAINNKRQTPLHLAALSQCSVTLELLLQHGANPNAADINGRTPLHCSIVKVSRSCDCVRLLLNAGAQVNKPDAFGYTAMHLAALNEFSHCLMLLLSYGGDVTARTKGGISVLTFITRKTPDVIPKYLSKFDAAIKLNDHEIGDVDCELKLDFRILVPTIGNKEADLLLNFIEVGHKEVLKHPLCETFLFLKWRKIRKFFLISMFFRIIFVILYSFYILGVFVIYCPAPRNSNFTENNGVNICPESSNYSMIVIGYAFLSFNVILLAKEIFQIAHNPMTYVRMWENWLQWMIIITAFMCVQPGRSAIPYWQYHIAAIGIFLAWVELMMIVGRFPIFGLFIQMFTTVSLNFTKFILAYFCLFIAFGLCFAVIFVQYKSFKDLKWIMIKIIVMMSGELEYEDVFFDEETHFHDHYTAQIMYLAFVILVTIILTNLMVGLAVSDIQGLQQSAGLDRLVRQAELVAHLESMLFSKLLTCIPHKLMHFLHNQALLLRNQYTWSLNIKPNDPREARIPKELIKNIYQLVVERKERPKSKRRRKNINFDYVSSPITSRINSSSSAVAIDRNKAQLEEIAKEFHEFSKGFKAKLEKLANQISK